MKQSRKPRKSSFPRYGLKICIEVLNKLEHARPDCRRTTADELARIIRESVTSSHFQMKVSACNAFGLLTGSSIKGSEIRVENSWFTYKDTDDVHNSKLLQVMALKPRIFSELAHRYNGMPVPGRKQIEADAITISGFSPSTIIRRFYDSFIETLTFAGLIVQSKSGRNMILLPSRIESQQRAFEMPSEEMAHAVEITSVHRKDVLLWTEDEESENTIKELLSFGNFKVLTFHDEFDITRLSERTTEYGELGSAIIVFSKTPESPDYRLKQVSLVSWVIGKIGIDSVLLLEEETKISDYFTDIKTLTTRSIAETTKIIKQIAEVLL